MKLKIMDYAGIEYFAQDAPLKDVENVIVRVVSGDELLWIKFKDGDERFLDVSKINNNPRLMDFYDGEYAVSAAELEKWNNRKDTYEWLWG